MLLLLLFFSYTLLLEIVIVFVKDSNGLISLSQFERKICYVHFYIIITIRVREKDGMVVFTQHNWYKRKT